MSSIVQCAGHATEGNVSAGLFPPFPRHGTEQLNMWPLGWLSGYRQKASGGLCHLPSCLKDNCSVESPAGSAKSCAFAVDFAKSQPEGTIATDWVLDALAAGSLHTLPPFWESYPQSTRHFGAHNLDTNLDTNLGTNLQSTLHRSSTHIAAQLPVPLGPPVASGAYTPGASHTEWLGSRLC